MSDNQNTEAVGDNGAPQVREEFLALRGNTRLEATKYKNLLPDDFPKTNFSSADRRLFFAACDAQAACIDAGIQGGVDYFELQKELIYQTARVVRGDNAIKSISRVAVMVSDLPNAEKLAQTVERQQAQQGLPAMLGQFMPRPRALE